MHTQSLYLVLSYKLGSGNWCETKKDDSCLEELAIWNSKWRGRTGNCDTVFTDQWKGSVFSTSEASPAFPIPELSQPSHWTTPELIAMLPWSTWSQAFTSILLPIISAVPRNPRYLLAVSGPSYEISCLWQQRGKDAWRKNLRTWAFSE